MREIQRMMLFLMGCMIGALLVVQSAKAGSVSYFWYTADTWPGTVKYGSSAQAGEAICTLANSWYPGSAPHTYSGEVQNGSPFRMSEGCYDKNNVSGAYGNAYKYMMCTSKSGAEYPSPALVSLSPSQIVAFENTCGTDPPPPDPCKDKAGKTASSGYFSIGNNAEGQVPSTACKDGCLAIFGGTCPAAVSLNNGVAEFWCQGSYVWEGSSCAAVGTQPTPVPKPPADTCPPGQEPYKKSDGKKGCKPTGEEPPEEPKPPTCTAPNTPPGCVGTPPPKPPPPEPPPGGGPPGEDEDEPPPPSSDDGAGKTFCEENPTAPGCNPSEFSGACTAGMGSFSCTGDAAACATAKAVAQLECRFHNSATFDQLRASIGNAYNPGNYMDNMTKTFDIADLIDMSNQDSGSCPSVPPIEVMGVTVGFPMEHLCDFAPVVRYIMIFAAAIIALRILFG